MVKGWGLTSRSDTASAFGAVAAVSSSAAVTKPAFPSFGFTMANPARRRGWKINRVKVDDGCYEVYGMDAKGQRAEAYFDPKSLEQVDTRDDG